MAELGKWSALSSKDAELLALGGNLRLAAATTYLESQWCRAFRKTDEKQCMESTNKYMGLYAHVPADKILPQLYTHAQKVIGS